MASWLKEDAWPQAPRGATKRSTDLKGELLAVAPQTKAREFGQNRRQKQQENETEPAQDRAQVFGRTCSTLL